jgi:hypothetical protein
MALGEPEGDGRNRWELGTLGVPVLQRSDARFKGPLVPEDEQTLVHFQQNVPLLARDPAPAENEEDQIEMDSLEQLPSGEAGQQGAADGSHARLVPRSQQDEVGTRLHTAAAQRPLA